MLVTDLMTSPVHAVRPSDSVSYVRHMMLKHHISRLLVLDEDLLVGMVTRKDLGFLHERKGPVWKTRAQDGEPVSTVMSRDVVWISPDSSVRDAMFLMLNQNISGFPVMDQGRILGIITKADLMRSPLVEQLNLEAISLIHPAVTITEGHSLDHVIGLIRNGACKVIVTDTGGFPIGIISESDLAFFEEFNQKADSTLASDVMRSPVLTLGGDAHVNEVMTQMRDNRITSVVITDDNRIKGIITRDDIIREVVQ